MRLIPDAALAWRFASVQAALLLTILTAVQADVVPMLQPLMDNATYLKVSAALSLLVIVLRVVAQPGLAPERRQLQAQALQPDVLTSDVSDQSAAYDQFKQQAIDAMALTLYQASQPGKPWVQVSPESQHKWRTVAAAALDWNYPGLVSGRFVEEHF